MTDPQTADSRPSTYAHIHEVQTLLLRAIADLQDRLIKHDASKLESPEREAYDRIDIELRGTAYGSEQYRAALRAQKPAIHHHYQLNPHHPEHWQDGIRDMSLLDLLEMLCDWAAAAKRHPNNDVTKTLPHNQDRFGYGNELSAILENTLIDLGYETQNMDTHRRTKRQRIYKDTEA
jgi:hypothetical protein